MRAFLVALFLVASIGIASGALIWLVPRGTESRVSDPAFYGTVLVGIIVSLVVMDGRSHDKAK